MGRSSASSANNAGFIRDKRSLFISCVSKIALAATVFVGTAAYAVETVEYQLSVEDIDAIKRAVAAMVPSAPSAALTLVIAQGRQAIDRTVYVCGLVGGLGTERANLLFFAERVGKRYVAQAIDLDVETPGSAKTRCEEYGFQGPTPHYTADFESLPKREGSPSACSYLCEPIEPNEF